MRSCKFFGIYDTNGILLQKEGSKEALGKPKDDNIDFPFCPTKREISGMVS